MNTSHDDNKLERALDALIVAALRADLDDTIPRLDADCPDLDADDLRALETLGTDFIARLLAGKRGPQTARVQPATRLELATAMNRGDDAGELTEKARREMDRRVEDLDQNNGMPHGDHDKPPTPRH